MLRHSRIENLLNFEKSSKVFVYVQIFYIFLILKNCTKYKIRFHILLLFLRNIEKY